MGIFMKRTIETGSLDERSLISNAPPPPAPRAKKDFEVASEAVQMMIDRLDARARALRADIERDTAELYETNKRLEALETAQSAYDQDTAEFQKQARVALAEEAA